MSSPWAALRQRHVLKWETIMADRILDTWWRTNIAAAHELAAASDLLEIRSLHHKMPRHLVAQFRCQGLVRRPGGPIQAADHFVVSLWFPDDYLHRAETFEVLTWLHPLNVWHPNIRPPAICAGHLSPGMAITDLLFQAYEIITYHKYATHDGLNPDACNWARQPENQRRFPLDGRPLRRRLRTFAAGHREAAERGGEA